MFYGVNKEDFSLMWLQISCNLNLHVHSRAFATFQYKMRSSGTKSCCFRLKSIFWPPTNNLIPIHLASVWRTWKGTSLEIPSWGDVTKETSICGGKQELKNSRREVDSRGTKNGGRLFYFGGILFFYLISPPPPLPTHTRGFALLIGPNTELLIWFRDWKWGAFNTR